MKLTELTNWPQYWEQLRIALLQPQVDKSVLESSLREAQSKLPVPVLWLLGKTQSGKTSIIKALTGSEAAEIGNGFQSCTRHSRFYDFPVVAPVIRFLDTRGLGEVSYDPAEDMHYCESQAHLLIAVMKAADMNQAPVFDTLHAIRQRHPEWPVVLVQTSLHELYPKQQEHITPWSYGDDTLPADMPSDLRRALQAQRDSLGTLPGFAPIQWVAVDLTLPEDGWNPPDYGLQALWQAIESLSSLGLQHLLSDDKVVNDLYARTAHQHIVGYTLAAAGLGALPVVDIVAVSTVQAKLLHSLAQIYGQRWDNNTITEFLGLAGVSMITGYVARALSRAMVKVVPVWGQTIGAIWGASASAATTYALGKAAIYFFTQRKNGLNVDAEILRGVYADAMKRGAELLKDRLQSQSR